MDIPEWPAVEGPRILTLIGNDITVDIRSRKTAASLSRSGFSVIAMGIASSKQAASMESHYGAFLCRYPITEEFRSIPFIFRMKALNISSIISSPIPVVRSEDLVIITQKLMETQLRQYLENIKIGLG